MRRFFGRDHADESKRLIPRRAQLVNLIRLDKHGVAHADRVPFAAQQHLSAALHDNYAMRMGVAFMRRMTAWRDREIADDEIACTLFAADQNPAHGAGSRTSFIRVRSHRVVVPGAVTIRRLAMYRAHNVASVAQLRERY